VYNDNFDISLNKLKQSDYGVDTEYNDVYLETCSLGSYEIGELQNKTISLWTKPLSFSQKEKIKNLYLDCNLSFNDENSTLHVVALNNFNKEDLDFILDKIKNKKILFYYQNQKYHLDNEKKDNELKHQLNYYRDIIENHTSYSWWTYIRHFIIKN
jgi:hypothetical protein